MGATVCLVTFRTVYVDKCAIMKSAMKSEPLPKLEGVPLADFDPTGADPVQELEIIDIREGTGEEVLPGAAVTAHYTGARCADGVIFQSSYDLGHPVTFPLNAVIKGWQRGVPGMRVGGKRRLIIPAEQAYGAHSPAANIPPHADLVFDIDILAIG